MIYCFIYGKLKFPKLQAMISCSYMQLTASFQTTGFFTNIAYSIYKYNILQQNKRKKKIK